MEIGGRDDLAISSARPHNKIVTKHRIVRDLDSKNEQEEENLLKLMYTFPIQQLPSLKDGISLKDEFEKRESCVKFIKDAGIMLELFVVSLYLLLAKT